MPFDERAGLWASSDYKADNRSFRIGKWVDETEARSLIEKVWDDWRSFASYAFNKSHAVCYAWLAYQSAYLKAHHPPAKVSCANRFTAAELW